MAALAAHPAVVAASPQAPMADLYMGDDGLHNGALYLAHYANYAYTMGQRPGGADRTGARSRLRFPTPDGYAFYLGLGTLKNLTAKVIGPDNAVWQETMAHEPYDAYWQALSTYPHLRDIKPRDPGRRGLVRRGGPAAAPCRHTRRSSERESGPPELDRHGPLAPQRLELTWPAGARTAARSPSPGPGPISRKRSSSRSSTTT
ncbi:MAG: CocE/NonD family hydrolase [Candidatus Moduliflexus flocculans]|nr:CocE/NonD family hydrolase [Candidatus Moduliflexus flocculans]